jgi:RNA polymerase-binding transcription factor
MTTNKLDSAFIEKQRHRLNKVRDELSAGTRAAEGREKDVRTESANSASREYEDDAQRLNLLELEEDVVTHDVARLERVNRALQKIEEGTYGLSDLSGTPIPRDRLEAVPESVLTFAEEKAREQKR